MPAICFSEQQIDLACREDQIVANVDTLPKSKSVFLLWAIAFSIQINADWSAELEHGYGGLLVGTAVGCAMYWCLAVVVVELVAAFPFTGGTAMYTRLAFGKLVGHIAAQCQIWELELNCVSYLVGLANDFNDLLKLSSSLYPLWWVLALVLCVSLMGFSHKLFSISIYALSIMSLLAVVIGPLIMIPFTTLWWNIENIRGSSIHASDASLFPNGVIGVLKCLPTAIWCFLGFEGVTMLSQETREFQKSGPHIMYWIMASVSLAYALQVIICPLVPPGVTTADGFRETILSISLSKIYPQQSVIIISLYSFLQKLVGLFASVYVLSRQLISLGHIHYLPHVITKTRYLSKSGKILSHTIPWFALIFEVIWVLVTAAIQYALPLTPISVFIKTGASLYSLAVCSFIFLSYLRLRLVAPFHRPVKVPIVIPCAITGLCIAFTTFGVMAADESYRISCLICIFKLVVECAVYIGYQWVLRRRRRRGRVNVLVFSSDDILNVQDYNI